MVEPVLHDFQAGVGLLGGGGDAVVELVGVRDALAELLAALCSPSSGDSAASAVSGLGTARRPPTLSLPPPYISPGATVPRPDSAAAHLWASPSAEPRSAPSRGAGHPARGQAAPLRAAAPRPAPSAAGPRARGRRYLRWLRRGVLLHRLLGRQGRLGSSGRGLRGDGLVALGGEDVPELCVPRRRAMLRWHNHDVAVARATDLERLVRCWRVRGAPEQYVVA